MSTSTTVTLSTLATVDEDQEALQRMNVIVKADASGSLEAIKSALRALPQDSVALRFLLASTGPITPSDIELARSSGALVMGVPHPPPPPSLPPFPSARCLHHLRLLHAQTWLWLWSGSLLSVNERTLDELDELGNRSAWLKASEWPTNDIQPSLRARVTSAGGG